MSYQMCSNKKLFVEKHNVFEPKLENVRLLQICAWQNIETNFKKQSKVHLPTSVSVNVS